jgi:hypothetical protein
MSKSKTVEAVQKFEADKLRQNLGMTLGDKLNNSISRLRDE